MGKILFDPEEREMLICLHSGEETDTVILDRDFLKFLMRNLEGITMPHVSEFLIPIRWMFERDSNETERPKTTLIVTTDRAANTIDAFCRPREETIH